MSVRPFDGTVLRVNLASLVENSGRRMEDIANECGITRATISRYLYDEGRQPQLAHIVALADYFRVSIDWLIGRSDNKHVDEMPEDIRRIIACYTKASPDDKVVIDAVLRKYLEV